MDEAGAARFPFPAAILAGGKSRRMGRDKSLLPLFGEPVVCRVARVLERVFSRVFVVANHAAPYEALGFRVVPDLLPGNDSLGGLHAAISQGGASHVFVAGCDMPFLHPSLLRGIAGRAGDGDVVIPIKDGYPEPLCALYGAACEPVIRRRIEQGRLKMIGFHDEVRVVRIEEAQWRAWDPEGLSFRNLNTPQEYESALAAESGEWEARSGC